MEKIKKMAMAWVIYVILAVVGLPAILTLWMGGFSEKDVDYGEEVISALEEYSEI